MSRTLQSEKKIPLFHPSMYETTMADTPQGTRSIREFEREYTKRIASDDLNKLVSPGNIGLTDKEADMYIPSKLTSKLMIEDSLLTFLFFSRDNVQNIQNILKYKIYKETNKVIDYQSFNELLIIMRSIYLEYSAHPPMISDEMDEATIKEITKLYTKEVARLNQIVIDDIYPSVLSQFQQYICYLRDASSLPYQQTQPTSSDNVKGQREYRSVTQVLLGTSL